MLRIHQKNKRGFTMVELLIVVSIMSLIVAAVVIPLKSSIGVWESGDRYAEVMQNALIGMDKITRELKHAKKIIKVSPSTIAPNDFTPYIQGYIKFTDRLDQIKKFALDEEGYIVYGTANPGPNDDSSDNLRTLSGPVNGLRFTCFQNDGSVPTTSPNKVAVIRVDIYDTYDSEGKVPPIPLTSKIRVRLDKGDDVYDITDYCMYGRAGITIKNNAVITSSNPDRPANIGALFDLQTKHGTEPSELAPGVQIDGNIVVGESLVLENGALVAQDVFVDNNVTISNNAQVMGNINCNNTVDWGGMDISENVPIINLSPDGTLTPSDYPGTLVEGGVPAEKFLCPLPEPTVFSIGTTDEIAKNVTISPGKYGIVDVNKNNGTLNLSSGTYYFKSLNLSNGGTININLSSGSGMIQIFVEGNVVGSSGENVVITGGDASKVFMEVYGNVTWDGIFHGTIFTPIYDDTHYYDTAPPAGHAYNSADHGNITIVNGSSSTGMSGALYCGGVLDVTHPNVAIEFIPPVSGTNGVLPWERTGTFLPD